MPINISPLQLRSSEGSSKSSFVSFLIQFLIVAVVFLLIGFVLGQKRIEVIRNGLVPHINVSNQLPPKDQNVDFSLFWRVFDELPKNYIDKTAINSQKMLYGAISGMVRSLGDPYTAFLDPKQNQAIQSEISGSYEGIGIQIGFNKDKKLTVIAPLRGTPAEREGILAGDLILQIDGKDASDLTLPEAVDLIRGSAGTKVKLLLSRKNVDKPLEKEVARATIDVKSVEIEFRQGKQGEIGIIRVSRFGEKTDSEWDGAVSQVLAKGVRGVIVDMRNNPGGLLSSSIHLSADFIKGTVVKQQFGNGSVKDLLTDHDGKLLQVRLVVLVNGGSASASEIFAGAIQDARRAQIVGEKTFGKGTVQDVIDLPQGAALHVTVAKWLTPRGNSIQDVGITPDIPVELTPADRDSNKDPQLDKALQLLD